MVAGDDAGNRALGVVRPGDAHAHARPGPAPAAARADRIAVARLEVGARELPQDRVRSHGGRCAVAGRIVTVSRATIRGLDADVQRRSLTPILQAPADPSRVDELGVRLTKNDVL